jgi:hypothetical protein
METKTNPMAEISSNSTESVVPDYSEKKGHHDVEINRMDTPEFDANSATKIYVPDENDEFIDPRLKNYPIPLVA